MKIRPAGAEYIKADTSTDRQMEQHEKAIRSFSLLCERA